MRVGTLLACLLLSVSTPVAAGVVYWEGEAVIPATHRGSPVAGFGYVELTGCAPYEPLDLGSSVGAGTPVP